ncbi:MAG: hypothetical protein RSC24_06690 [Clostridium sp.]
MNAVCHTVKVKETNRGGRLYSAIHTAPLQNGSIVFLGGLVAGETEIRQALVPSTQTIADQAPMLVMCPEMIYDQSRMSSQALGNFINPANKAFPVIPLTAFDEIEVSKEAFEGTPSVGKYVKLKDGSTKLEISTTKPDAGVLYGKITSSRKSSMPTVLGGSGALIPSIYDLYNVEFIAL